MEPSAQQLFAMGLVFPLGSLWAFRVYQKHRLLTAKSCWQIMQEVLQTASKHRNLALFRHVSATTKQRVQTQMHILHARRIEWFSVFCSACLWPAFCYGMMTGDFDILSGMAGMSMFYLLCLRATCCRAYFFILVPFLCNRLLFVRGPEVTVTLSAAKSMRVILMAILPNTRAFSAFNLVLVISDLLLIFQQADSPCIGTEHLGMGAKVWNFGWVIIMCFVLETIEWNRILALQSARSSSQRLLVGMSDAIVHLTSTKHIFQGSPELATLLSLPSGPNALLNTNFMELVAASDRQRVQNFMDIRFADGHSEDELPVQMLPMRLVSADHVQIEVDTYLVKHPGFDGSTHYLLGVCDTGRRARHKEDTGQRQTVGQQELLGDDAQVPLQIQDGQQPNEEIDGVSQVTGYEILVDVQRELAVLGIPAEADIHMSLNSWLMQISGSEQPNLPMLEVDFLQHEQEILHMLQLESQRLWMQDLLTEILGCTPDAILQKPCAVKFHLAFSAIYSAPIPVQQIEGHPVAVVNNVICSNFETAPSMDVAQAHILQQ